MGGTVVTVLRSPLAIVLGFVAVGLVKLAATPLIGAVLPPGALTSEGLPLSPLAQMVSLPALFIAGMAGAFLVVLVAPRAPAAHAVVFRDPGRAGRHHGREGARHLDVGRHLLGHPARSDQRHASLSRPAALDAGCARSAVS